MRHGVGIKGCNFQGVKSKIKASKGNVNMQYISIKLNNRVSKTTLIYRIEGPNMHEGTQHIISGTWLLKHVFWSFVILA